MTANLTQCGNCGTLNEPGRDACVECGLPLTRSGAQELVSQQDAMDEGGLLATDHDPLDTAAGVGPAVRPAIWPWPAEPLPVAGAEADRPTGDETIVPPSQQGRRGPH